MASQHQPQQPQPAPQCRYSCCSDVPFDHVVRFAEQCHGAAYAKRDAQAAHFLACCVPRPSPDIFQIFRLLLPAEDLERRVYRLKHDKLARLLVGAAGLSKESPKARNILHWRQSGVKNAGQFPEVAEQNILRGVCQAEPTNNAERKEVARRTATVGEINALLDELAAADMGTHQQEEVVRRLFGRTTARQFKWLIKLILKDVRIGLSKDKLLKALHPDALFRFNMSSDLKDVCVTCADPRTRIKKTDLEPGRFVRSQLCKRVNSVEEMFAKLKGSFVVETKFDGFRMQIHSTPEGLAIFSRKGIEHAEGSDFNVFQGVVTRQVVSPTVVLDGELVVWNKVGGVFEPFGGIMTLIKAVARGAEADEVVHMTDKMTGTDFKSDDYLHPQAGQLELVFMAFDIIFDDGESLLNAPLLERQRRLSRAVRCLNANEPGVPLGLPGRRPSPICGRIVPLLPNQPAPMHIAGAPVAAPPPSAAGAAPAAGCSAPTPALVFSRIGNSQHDLQDMLELSNSRQEEGIVAKALHSVWKPDDRSGTWLKLKPDYFHVSEIDALVIGAYFGTGRNGGLVSEFLLGLAEGGRTASRWCSFCKVGTGMTDIERKQMRERLEPILAPVASGAKPPPCYRITGREKPDFWVVQPLQSLVLEVQSDIRTIITSVYAADHSLRFPRVVRVRWDRHPSDVMTYAELEQQVLQNKGQLATIRAAVQAGVDPGARKRKSGKAGRAPVKAPLPRIVGPAALVDTSGVQSETSLLAGTKLCLLAGGLAPGAKAELSRLIKKHGGEVVGNPTPDTDYVIASSLSADYVAKSNALLAAGKGEASVHDVLSVAWLRELDEAGQWVQLMPRHFLFMSACERRDDGGCLVQDAAGDPVFQELQPEDVSALVERVMPDGLYRTYQQQLEQGRSLLLQQEDQAVAREAAASDTAAAAAAAAAADDGGVLLDPSRVSTEASVVLDLQCQLRALVGWRDNSAVLFAGCTLLFLPFEPQPPAQPAAVAGLTPDAQAAARVAACWSRLLAEQALEEAKLAVMQHGGCVAPRFCSSVTHIVLWPLGWRQAQLAGGHLLAGDDAQPGAASTAACFGGLGSAQQVALPVQQLLALLAGAASAAADGAIAAAAAGTSGGAAAAGGSVRSPVMGGSSSRGRSQVLSRHRKARIAIAPPQPGGKTAAGSSQAPADSQQQPAPAADGSGAGAVAQQAAAPGIQQLTARLAAGGTAEGSAVMDSVLAERSAAAGQQLSPAALRVLRKLRRRLAAGQPWCAANGHPQPEQQPQTEQAPQQHRVPASPLLLVEPAWVVDSLEELRLQRQAQHLALTQADDAPPALLTQGVSTTQEQRLLAAVPLTQQRRSELLYGPRILGQQQEQAVQEEQQQQPQRQPDSVAAGSVLEWPWDSVGLVAATGTSSGDSSDGGASQQQQRTPSKPAGAGRRKQQRGSSQDAAAGAAAAPKRRRGTAAAAPASDSEAAGAGRGAAAGSCKGAKRQRGGSEAQADGGEADGESDGEAATRQQQALRQGARGRAAARHGAAAPAVSRGTAAGVTSLFEDFERELAAAPEAAPEQPQGSCLAPSDGGRPGQPAPAPRSRQPQPAASTVSLLTTADAPGAPPPRRAPAPSAATSWLSHALFADAVPAPVPAAAGAATTGAAAQREVAAESAAARMAAAVRPTGQAPAASAGAARPAGSDVRGRSLVDALFAPHGGGGAAAALPARTWPSAQPAASVVSTAGQAPGAAPAPSLADMLLPPAPPAAAGRPAGSALGGGGGGQQQQQQQQQQRKSSLAAKLRKFGVQLDVPSMSTSTSAAGAASRGANGAGSSGAASSASG